MELRGVLLSRPGRGVRPGQNHRAGIAADLGELVETIFDMVRNLGAPTTVAIGLLADFNRAVDLQKLLRQRHPEEPNAKCHLWAIFRERTSTVAQ